MVRFVLVFITISPSGSGLNPLRGQSNVQGGGDMGALPNRLVGGWNYGDPKGRQLHEQVWGSPVPEKMGKHQTLMLEAMEKNEIKAVYVIGENPVQSDANGNQVEKIFKDLDFLVVQDILMTKTAMLADVVLPATGWAENDGTLVNSERRIQRVRPALKGPGVSRHAQDSSRILPIKWERNGIINRQKKFGKKSASLLLILPA